MESKPLVEAERMNGKILEPLVEAEKMNGKIIEPLVEAQKMDGKIIEPLAEAEKMNGKITEPLVEAQKMNGQKTELKIRQLEISDHAKGFVELLGQLSPCPSLSQSEFEARFAELVALGDDHHIAVVEDPASGRIVATGSVFIEKKFLRGCSSVAHIEDVVVDKATRGAHLGQRIVNYLVDHAKAASCYKVILDCTPELRVFYEKCGFLEKNVQMALYF